MGWHGLSAAPDYDAVVREVYGDADAVEREAYRARPSKPRGRSRRKATVRHDPPRRTEYRVTADARVKCDCGVYVYTERIFNGSPALPTNCWRCERLLPS